MQRILVWDWPTRVGHWAMAACFLIAYATGDGEAWRDVHVMAGGALAGLILFRVLWGVLGSRHARFVNFVGAPRAAWDYLVSLGRGRAAHFTGHNPAGAWAIVLLLIFGWLASFSGWAVYQELGGEWLEEGHEALANGMLLVVLGHLAGVLVGSLAHGENLARAMLTGLKRGVPEEAIRSAWLVAVPGVLACAGVGAWLLSR